MRDVLAILCRIRHHCFIEGVLKRVDGYIPAFRTLNSLYVQERDGSGISPRKPSRTRKRSASTRVAENQLRLLGL